jgi:integrase
MSNGKHPGVTILKANQHHARRARWVDPVTGRRRVQALPADPREAEQWVLRKSAELLLRRARTDPPPGDAMPLELAVEKYLKERHRLRASTLAQYRHSIDKLVRWLGDKPPSLPQLRRFRAYLDAPGRAAASVNRDLAHVSAFLNHARAAGDVLLTRDQISDGLRRLPSDHEKKEPLTREELRRLLEVLRTAPDKYRAFVLVVLLTGMRTAECLHLRPERIHGKEIRLLRQDTKTRRARTIDLSISPTCLALLDGFTGWGFTRDQLRSLRRKLHPWATFKRMRITCGTYLTCAPGIYGGASAYMSAARLGHSVAIAERHYVGVVTVEPSACTLEQAMGLSL